MCKLYDKTMSISQVVSKNYKGYSSYCCWLRVTLSLFRNVLFENSIFEDSFNLLSNFDHI